MDTPPSAGVLAASSRFLRYMDYTTQIVYWFNKLDHSVGTKNWQKVSFLKGVYYENVEVCAKFQLSTTCVAHVTALWKVAIKPWKSVYCYCRSHFGADGPDFFWEGVFKIDTLHPAGVPAASSRFLRYMYSTTQNLYNFNQIGYSVGTRNWRKVSFRK
jgi:hypothetical protein